MKKAELRARLYAANREILHLQAQLREVADRAVNLYRANQNLQRELGVAGSTQELFDRAKVRQWEYALHRAREMAKNPALTPWWRRQLQMLVEILQHPVPPDWTPDPEPHIEELVTQDEE